MKIPQHHEVVRVEHRGDAIQCVVDDVSPDSASPLFHWVWLIVPADRQFTKPEQCYWLTDDGQRIPAMVHEIARSDDIVKIRLRAIADG